MNPILGIILISLAGPIIGSAIGVSKRPSKKLMHNMIAFTAGVMLSISFLELLPESLHLAKAWVVMVGILLGGIAMYFIDTLLPNIHPGFLNEKDSDTLLKKPPYT